ncbi:MAG TPA: DUF5678 domain-containing protein [Pyrinomonadaceae bacterium]|nr:DUF5678 domain-containing protein [Pyrinomonadaceae bacterium]
MELTTSEIIQAIETLPSAERAEIRQWLNEERKAENAKKADDNWQIERYKKARKWLDKHSEEYMNQWVCLEGDQLIAHGTDGLEVHRKAKEAGIKIPFVHHIVPEIDWGGW